MSAHLLLQPQPAIHGAETRARLRTLGTGNPATVHPENYYKRPAPGVAAQTEARACRNASETIPAAATPPPRLTADTPNALANASYLAHLRCVYRDSHNVDDRREMRAEIERLAGGLA